MTATGLIGISCGHSVPRKPVVQPSGRKLYWCETCGEHRMSGGPATGLRGFDFLLMLKDEITSRDLVVRFDLEPDAHHRAVVAALGAKIEVRRSE